MGKKLGSERKVVGNERGENKEREERKGRKEAKEG